MEVAFYKYQGTGNDFIIVDNRDNRYDIITQGQINHLCHRRFGIGADGFMMLSNATGYDFEMKYFNADGFIGTMCGNGGRCIVRFADDMGIKKTNYLFLAADGPHEAAVYEAGLVSLKMKDVDRIGTYKGDHLVNTGSPHYVKLADEVETWNVYKEGRAIRYSRDFEKEGINVNFVQLNEDDSLVVRTYERGVEDETLSCGTGVTAAALVYYHNENGFNSVDVHTRGGDLNVRYHRHIDKTYERIWLKGPAVQVFKGLIEI